jgi:hypothetical protein
VVNDFTCSKTFIRFSYHNCYTKKEQISTIAEYDPFDEIFDAFYEYFNRCYFYNYMISTIKDETNPARFDDTTLICYQIG